MFGLGKAKSRKEWEKAVESAAAGELSTAREHLQESVRLNPADERSREDLEIMESALAGRLAHEAATSLFKSALLARGLISKAWVEAERAQQSGPESEYVLRNLGFLAVQQAETWGDCCQKAIEYFRTAVKFNPESARAHYDLGTAFMAADREYEAIDAYKAAIKISPDFAAAHNNLAFCYRDAGYRKEMGTHRDRALELGYKVDLAALNGGPRQLLKRYSRPVSEIYEDGHWTIKCPIEGLPKTIYSGPLSDGDHFEFTCIGHRVDIRIVNENAVVCARHRNEWR